MLKYKHLYTGDPYGGIWSYTRGGGEMWPTHMWPVVHPHLGVFLGGQHLNHQPIILYGGHIPRHHLFH